MFLNADDDLIHVASKIDNASAIDFQEAQKGQSKLSQLSSSHHKGNVLDNSGRKKNENSGK